MRGPGVTYLKKIQLFLLVMAAFILAGCDEREPPEQDELPTDETAEPAGPAEWLTDYEEALDRAAREEKQVLMNFTGSNWCPPCQFMQRQVFQTEPFHRYAHRHLILLELDYPIGLPQPDELKKQNMKLEEKYKIEQFPTYIVLNPDGSERKRSEEGAFSGGVDEFLKWLRE